MKTLSLVLCFVAISHISHSQIKALTENGKEVTLFENGTWKYSLDSSNNNQNSTDSLTTNKTKFSRSNAATFLVKSTAFNVGIFINPAKWTFNTHKDNETNPEYRFGLKTGEGYVMMITEKTPISLETMRQIALLNAQKASLDVRETSAEYRIVNNKKVLCLKFQGTIKGVKFVYFSYYYSNPKGTVQLISYSSQQFFDAVQKELENCLNGLVEIEN